MGWIYLHLIKCVIYIYIFLLYILIYEYITNQDEIMHTKYINSLDKLFKATPTFKHFFYSTILTLEYTWSYRDLKPMSLWSLDLKPKL